MFRLTQWIEDKAKADAAERLRALTADWTEAERQDVETVIEGRQVEQRIPIVRRKQLAR
jgi:hypothetical protein